MRELNFPTFKPTDILNNTEKFSARENKDDKYVSLFDIGEVPTEPKLVTLWRILGGDYFGHVTLNNLRMVLLAIKGLHV